MGAFPLWSPQDFHIHVCDAKLVRWGIVKGLAWQHLRTACQADIPGHFSVHQAVDNVGGGPCPGAFRDACIPGDQRICFHNPCHDDGVVLHHRAVADHGASQNQGAATDDRQVADLGISGHQSILRRDGALENPTGSLLAEVVLGLDKAAQVALAHRFPNIPQGLDAVEPGIFWVRDACDAVFFLYRSSPRFFFEMCGPSSVSTYWLMISSAFS